MGGYPVCDLYDEINGGVFTGCRFLCVGGGSPIVVSYDPPAVGARVLYAILQGTTQAIVLGSVFAPEANRRLTDNPPEVEYDEEYPAQVGVGDKYCERGDSWMFLTDDGQFVFDASTSMRPFRVQLSGSDSGHLRISQDGQADERVLLAGPTRSYIDGLRTDVNNLILLTQQIVAELASGPKIALPGSATSAGKLKIGLSTDTDLVASAVRISSRSVQEDGV
jgi:hypothetical protein